MSAEKWLLAKFSNDKHLVDYIKQLYPSDVTEAAIKAKIGKVDAKAKAFYLIALSRLAFKNTNLRNRLPGPAFVSLDANDFDGKTQRVQQVAVNNNVQGWPSPTGLFEDEKLLQAAIKDGLAQMPGEKAPKTAKGYAARLGATYGIDPQQVRETLYRFALFHRPIQLAATEQNKAAINELLFLIADVANFPAAVRAVLLDAFRQVGGPFDANEKPLVVDTKAQATDESLAQQAAAAKEKLDSYIIATRGTKRAEDEEELTVLRETTNKCAEAFQDGFSQGERSMKNDIRSQAEKYETLLKECQEQVEKTKTEVNAKHQSDSEKLTRELKECQTAVQDKQKQLDEQRASAKEEQEAQKETQKELKEKIAQYEKSRAEEESALDATKKTHGKLQTKLAALANKLARINQLEKKCGAIGKSIAEELGEAMAAKLQTVAGDTESLKASLETQLATIETQIDAIEQKVSDAYENECHYREQLTLLDNAASRGDREYVLQQELETEREKVESCNRKLELAKNKTAEQIALLGELETRFASLKKDLERHVGIKKESNAALAALEQEVRELLDENANLTSKGKRCEANIKLQEKKCADKLAEQEATVENRRLDDSFQQSLKQQLKQCQGMVKTVKKEVGDQQNLLEEQAERLRQMDALREENVKLHQKIMLLEQEKVDMEKELNIAKDERLRAATAGQQLLDRVTVLQNQLKDCK